MLYIRRYFVRSRPVRERAEIQRYSPCGRRRDAFVPTAAEHTGLVLLDEYPVSSAAIIPRGCSDTVLYRRVSCHMGRKETVVSCQKTNCQTIKGGRA